MPRKPMPNTRSVPFVNSGGQIEKPWRDYIEQVPVPTIASLGPTPTNAELSTAFNDLIAKLKKAGLMETV
jgi:hypothetical protein